MSQLAIKAENISKQYRLGQIGTGTISHDLNRFWYRIRGKEDPYLKIGETNDRTTRGNSNYVWSLKDVNFEINQGDAVGIIGRNGAGKSTLLKLLSRVTKPTTGNFRINGRIASLLEVGTGFNPEMTGKENIYLNGAILGMRRHEITRKFDEIVDFSGVEKYIDTPVKRYSSGMYVRLAFAVAAHLESEILIVDEVLAVGDAEFQKKCLGKMGDVSKGEGRTVLFVSHNITAIKTLCNRGIVLDKGMVAFDGGANEAALFYSSENMKGSNSVSFDPVPKYNTSEFTLESIEVKNADTARSDFSLDDNSAIDLITKIQIKNHKEKFHLSYLVHNDLGEILFTMPGRENLLAGNNNVIIKIPKGFFNVGSYSLSLYIIKNKQDAVFYQENLLNFKVVVGSRELGEWMGIEPGFVKTNFEWING